jgi:hypothetical protein
MAYKENEKTLNVDIDEVVFDSFETQRTSRKQIKKGAVEWAIRAWMSLPTEIQATLIDQKPKDVHGFLVNRLLDIEILKLLSQLPPQERINALRSGKLPKKKVSRKKKT